MNSKHLENLQKMIQKETISLPGQTDLTKFREFHALLEELFPSLWSASEVEDINGSLLIKWKGKQGNYDNLNTALPIMLMSHHDVVEENGEWPDHGPFSADIADGRVWGRGVLDTKGDLWAELQAADDLAKEGFTPATDIYFESACNEEIDGSGAKAISKILQDRGIRFKFVLDEGGYITDGIADIGLGEKGVNEIQFTATSEGGHASVPPLNSPLVRLGRFMAYVDDHRDELFPKAINKETGTEQQTSCAFTMANGAKARNVLPREAYVIASVRTSHHQGVEGSFKALSDAASKFDVTASWLDKGMTVPVTDVNSDGYKQVISVIQSQFPDATIKPYIMAGATDSNYMRSLTDAVIRFAPFKVDEAQLATVHSAGENIYIDSLEPAVEFYKALIKTIIYHC